MPQTIKAEELLIQQYKWIDEQDSIGKSLSCFDESCDVLLVKNKNQQYTGILTERMILRSGLDREKTKVKTLKRFAPKIELKTPVPTIAGLMIENDVLHIPVFHDEQVVGIIDDIRLLTAVAAKDFGKQLVTNFMSTDICTIEPHEKIAIALHKFRDYHIGRLPVVNDENIVGMITVHDVVTRMILPKQRALPEDVLHEKTPVWDLPVEGIMTNPVVTSSIDALLQDVINKMVRYRISGIPIVDQSSILKGIVTKKDILCPISLVGEARPYPVIQFSSKLHGEYQDDLRVLIEQFAERQKDRLSHATFTIFLREYKPEKQKLRLISVRVRLFSDFGRFAVSSEGWGPHNAMKQALHLLEQQIHRKISEKRSFARVYKQKSWTYEDIEELT
jgi:CBS domain-containing protein